MKRSVLSVLAATFLALATACNTGSDDSNGGGGSGGSGSSLFVQSCSLGCSSGQGGSQVSCAIVNTFQNQEIALEFSQPVDLSSVTSSSFQIVDVITGQTPNGSFAIDQLNARRLVFRPALGFTISGAVQFGFGENRSYQILVPGTDQGDPPPYIRSTTGNANRSRVLCTITTSQGIADPVPGQPTVAAFVDVVDPVTSVITPDVPADGATNVSLSSQITFTFNDLMDIGSLIIPATGASPSIIVSVDGDGDPSTVADQVSVAGTYTFSIDLTNLSTTLVFTPSAGFPSAGTGSPKRVIVVNVPLSVVDIAGNSVGNPGLIVFEPESVAFPPVGLSESFDSTTNLEVAQTGANMWGQSNPSPLTGQMLGKGVGGGSGRLGRLSIGSGETVTFDTSPLRATGSLVFSKNPCNGETFEFDGQTFAFVTTPVAATDLPIRTTTALTVDETARLMGLFPFSQPLTFSAMGGTTVVVTAANPGSAGNAFQLVALGNSLLSNTNGCSPTASLQVSGFTLAGGSDGQVFAARTLIDNFDYQANPGVTPNDILVTDGIFEFSSLDISTGGRLAFRGDNPARLFVRGKATVSNSATITGSGSDGPNQIRTLPDGELGGVGGPNAGAGGRGGDRDDNNDTGAMGLLTLGAVMNPGSQLDGSDGGGVGQTGLAAGQGGLGWVTIPPLTTASFGNWVGNLDPSSGAICRAFQVAGPGSGGAYALDGGDGIPVVPIFDDDASMTSTPVPFNENGESNLPDPGLDGIADPTPGGSAAALAIEPPNQPPVVRLLDPDAGNLRGGSGGGGAGSSIFGTQALADFVSSFPATCDGPFASIQTYVSSSGAPGGGGGGALQVQVGETLTLNGSIDATGGNGGNGIAPTGINMGTTAWSEAGWSAAGGGGSGGAVLVQGHTVNLSTTAGSRIDVSGGSGGLGLQDGTGGDGSPGLMRLEDATGGLTALTAAAVTAPMLPNLSEDVLSVGPGTFDLGTTLPRGFQGAQSCWMRPDGNFFQLTFDDDGVGTFGWDATIAVDFGSGPVEISYRDPAQNGGIGALGGQSAQAFWGNLIDRDLTLGQTAAPFVVRFQGAQSLNVSFTKVQPADPFSVACNVDDGPQSAQIQGLTPWVQHPSELNAFTPPPNMIRWVVIFDASHPDASRILGVSDISISSSPD